MALQYLEVKSSRACPGGLNNENTLGENQWHPVRQPNGNVLRRRDKKCDVLNAEKRKSNFGIDL